MKNNLSIIADHFSSVTKYPIEKYDFDCSTMLNEDNSIYCVILEIIDYVRYITFEKGLYKVYQYYSYHNKKCFGKLIEHKNYKVIIAKMHNLIELS